MVTTTASPPAAVDRLVLRSLRSLLTTSFLAAVCLVLALKTPSVSPLAIVGTLAVIGAVLWMFLNERYVWSFAVIMLYLGLLDGYLKLGTGSPYGTLIRDALLYAVVAGALIRIAVRGEPLELPPLTGWVIAWVLIVLVQIANPGSGTLLHGFASVRPHAEWVPLFFFGYAIIRRRSTLRGFLFLLVFIAAINGIVGLIQLNLSPSELSNWGPGYAKAISGEGSVSSRVFVDNSGEAHTRPFALGGDFGFGGLIGMIAVPAALALLALSRQPRVRLATALLSFGVVLAVATSQARVAVVGSFIAVFAFALLTVASRAGLRTVIALGLTVIVAYTTISLLTSDSKQGSFDRYESISGPGQAVSTTVDYRRDTLARVPKYAVQFPFGAGIGSSGPAAGFGGEAAKELDAESEPTFMLIELGIPGLVFVLAFNLLLFYLCITRIRRIEDRETRVLLTGVAAPLFAIFSTGFVGATTATVPGAPYLWLSAGILAYWLLARGPRSEGFEVFDSSEGTGAPTLVS